MMRRLATGIAVLLLGSLHDARGEEASPQPSPAAAGACVESDCGSHKWACWPMPTPSTTNGKVHASYTDLGDGTVRDDVTCLVWQKSVPATRYNWADGQTYCSSLGSGWRLPTRIEMTSIVDYARRPSIDPTAFPGTPTSGYYYTGSGWIVSNLSGKPQYTWIFSFANGFTSNAGARTDLDNIRCVKGNGTGEAPTDPAIAPAHHYSVSAGEVTDNYTELVWQQAMSPKKMALADAAAYCASLVLNGHSGWRVPTLHELSALVDEAVVAPAIDREAFPDTPSHNKGTVVSTDPPVVVEDKDWFWSSTPVAGSATLGWGLNFMDGFTGPQGTTPVKTASDGTVSVPWNYWTSAWVKCVR